MSKFSDRAFGGSGEGRGSTGGGTTVDWKEYNNHIANAVKDAVGIEEGSPEVVIGYISGVVDLGIHQDPEVEEQYQQVGADNEKSNAFRKKLVEAGTGELFIQEHEGREVEMIRYTPKPAREVVYFIDFPEIVVDKGQFFGDSNPAPYRIMWGGVFKGKPARPVKVTGYPKDGKWMCGNGSFHVKMAKAAGVNVKDGFAQDQILDLIGKPVAVSLEVYVNDQGFLQEKMSNPTKPARGVAIPEYDDSLLFYVGMYDAKNSDQDIKFLPKVLKEYIAEASNFEGSALQKQLDKLDESKVDSKEGKPDEEEENTPPTTSEGESSEEGDSDKDFPF